MTGSTAVLMLGFGGPKSFEEVRPFVENVVAGSHILYKLGGGTVRASEVQEAAGVAGQHLLGDLVGATELGERRQPLVVRDERVVGAEEHAILEPSLDVAHELGREVTG